MQSLSTISHVLPPGISPSFGKKPYSYPGQICACARNASEKMASKHELADKSNIFANRVTVQVLVKQGSLYLAGYYNIENIMNPV
jgi:hypothetical protein